MTSGAVEEDKNRSVVTDHQHHNQQPPLPPSQGYPNYPPPPQATGFPQPSQPSGEGDNNASVVTDHQHHKQPPPPQFQGTPNYPPPPQYPQATGYTQPAQPYAPGYAVVGGMPVTQPEPLPCCGLGVGWVLFIIGFFITTITWYIGFILLLFSKNRRERPGYIACTIGAVFATIFIVYLIVRESRGGF